MVHKSARYGVHSGNTLRSSNTRYSRRYFSEAYIISRVHSRLLAKLSPSVLPEATADSKKQQEKVHCPNVAIDVALSLNKQARWLLPLALKRQITSEDVADPTLTVSLLERHKLKRHANCVTFCSTHTGTVTTIQPRDGRYFSFAFPSSDGLSKRAKRRELRKQRLHLLQAQKNGGEQEVETTPSDSHATGEGEPADKDLLEGEVRYEVFYPCPWRSSLSHNPKYIKQHMILTAGDDGKYAEQGKPHKKHRRRQRKRMTLKDISNNDDSDEEFWFDLDDDDEDVSHNHADDWGDGSFENVSTLDLPLVTLLQTRGGVQHMFQRSKTKVSQTKRKDTADVGDKKSRVIYVTAETETRDSTSSSKSVKLSKAIVSPPAEEEVGLEGALPE